MSLYLGTSLVAPSQANAANKSLSNLNADGQAVLNKKADKLYQDAKACTGGTIALEDGKSLYVHAAISSATTFTFNTTALTNSTDYITFELLFDMSTVSTLTFPSNLDWLDSKTPDVSQTGLYMFAFRKHPSWTNWKGCLEGRW